MRYWQAGLVALTLGLAAPAVAQTVVGTPQLPDVVVDQGVLDRLGGVPSLPDLYLHRQIPGTSAPLPAAAASYPTNLRPAPVETAPRSAALSVTLRQPHPTQRPAKRAVVAKRPHVIRAVAQAETAKAETPHDAKAPAEVVSVPGVAAPAPVPLPDHTPKPALPREMAQTVVSAVATNPVIPAPAKKAVAKAATAVAAALPPPAAEVVPVPVPVVPVQAPATPPTPITPPVPVPAPVAEPAPVKAEAAPPAPAPVLPASPVPAPVPEAVVSTPPPAPALPQQEAKLSPPSGGVIATGEGNIILFERDGAKLPDQAKADLIRLAGRMAVDGGINLTLMAYAEGDEDGASKAKRLSLARALAVRSFLIDQGVRPTRVEVRALGNKYADGPADRVDVLVQGR